MLPKPKEAPVAGSVDPLSGLSGLSLFPRTIGASADAPVSADPKDLDSIHNIMKSLKELRSPEKLMSEAKKIVDGGANLLSNFSSFAENVSITYDIAAKAKDRPQEKRPGLGLARKKASFSLKTSSSHPPVNLEPTLDIDRLEDPDAFFDAYERIENAKKEIQKQTGVGGNNINLYKPSNNERRRRPGILGKSYNYKHRYSSTPSENDDMWMSSQETVHQDIPSPPNDVLHKKLIDPDPNLSDVEEIELAESMKKTESRVNDMLEELLSYSDDDLEGQGAFNILQERLKIKTLDKENMRYLTKLPDVGRTDILTSPGSRQMPRRSSVVLDSVLKNLNKEPRAEQELVENSANLVSSPTPPRNPFGSISLLKKKILQPNPLRDPFSPQDIDLCPHPNSSPANPKDKLLGQVDILKDLGHELESHVKFGRTESAISDMDSQQVVQNADSLPEQSLSENASMPRESGSTKANASPAQLRDKLVGQADVPKELGMLSEMESNVTVISTNSPLCNSDKHEVNENADGLPEQSLSENASMQRESGSTRANASPAQLRDKLVGQDDVPKELGMLSEMESNVTFISTNSPLCNSDKHEVNENADGFPEQSEDENASMDASSRQNEEPNNNSGEAMNINNNESNPSVIDEEARNDASIRRQINPEQQEVHAVKQKRGKRVAGDKRIRDAHPMRKSLAEAGTTFETGVRRSKRIRMRPLEYWKGERFLYGRVEDSFKLIGLKYISPEKGNENLKVKPYILSEKPEYKELLDLAARH
ncbi:centromere protein C [Salvia miltiorrhiza]|uniref:centromere protein C n=1 Tax=Salvia miltiorrhiza TaxID=226208 RepID=UPI0025ABF5CC|nr:centromere protein C [Salvia miltiorrhiza]XP_057772979.1 centromere protein C [Salvia miltiorrhiza]